MESSRVRKAFIGKDTYIEVVINTMEHRLRRALEGTRIDGNRLTLFEGEKIAVMNFVPEETLPMVIREEVETGPEEGRKVWKGANFTTGLFGVSPLISQKVWRERAKAYYVVTREGEFIKVPVGHSFDCRFVRAAIGGEPYIGVRCDKTRYLYDTEKVYLMARYRERGIKDALAAWQKIRAGLSLPT